MRTVIDSWLTRRRIKDYIISSRKLMSTSQDLWCWSHNIKKKWTWKRDQRKTVKRYFHFFMTMYNRISNYVFFNSHLRHLFRNLFILQIIMTYVQSSVEQVFKFLLAIIFLKISIWATSLIRNRITRSSLLL